MIFQFLISTVGNLYDTNPKKGTNTMNISKKKYPYPFTFFDPHKNRKKISAIPYQPSPLPTKLRVTEGYVLGGRPPPRIPVAIEGLVLLDPLKIR